MAGGGRRRAESRGDTISEGRAVKRDVAPTVPSARTRGTRCVCERRVSELSPQASPPPNVPRARRAGDSVWRIQGRVVLLGVRLPSLPLSPARLPVCLLAACTSRLAACRCSFLPAWLVRKQQGGRQRQQVQQLSRCATFSPSLLFLSVFH